MVQGHGLASLPQLSETLAIDLGRIATSMVLRVPYGYIQPGANVAISCKTVERLEGLGLVRPHPECGRKTIEPTPLGLRTLAADEGNMKHAQEVIGRRHRSSIAEAAPSSGLSVRFQRYVEILEPLCAMAFGLRAPCQVIWSGLAFIHAGRSRSPLRPHSAPPPDHGAGMMTTRPASRPSIA